MKKKALLLMTLAMMAAGAKASLLVNESFNYADGSLVTVAPGTWITHSGTTGQVDVASQKVIVSGSESEDVSTAIAGAPYTTGMIYMSAKVNFSTLPTGSGAYFIHFRDNGTANFKARVFAVTTGAGAGSFRLGVSNSNGAVTNIPTDLSLNTDYTIVVRINAANSASTLWINPSGEGSATDRADDPNTTTSTAINFVCLRQASGEGVLSLDDIKVGTAFSDVVGVNPNLNPPTVSAIADQSIPANSNTGPLAFTVSDGETPAASLVLTKNSSNLTLVPAANIVYGGSGTNRTVTVTPAAGQEGSATVTVTVTDGDNNSVDRTFVVTVGSPSISAITEQTTQINTPTAAIPFTVGDAETAPGSLTITKESTNTTLVSASGIVLGGSGANRTVTITPEPGQTGVTLIRLSVTDGFNTVSNSFVVVVSPYLGVILTDTFSYPDAPIYLNEGSPWTSHSGTAGQVLIADGKCIISSTNSEDVSVPLTNAPYSPIAGVVFYSKFTVNFSALPTGSAGDYFAHYKDGGTTFRAKIFAVTNGAAAGTFRLGIANSANNVTPASTVATDLNLNTTYTVVTRYNSGAGTSKIWLNPSYETDLGAVAADAASTGTNSFYALRESAGMGTITIDDLKIGTKFTDVVDFVAPPSPIPLNISYSGGNVTLTWTNAAFKLQSATDASGTYNDVPSASSPYTTPASGTTKFFRLKF